MFENIINFFKRITKKETSNTSSKDTAKERLHLVLMQDRANVSADFLDLMRQEIIEVIKKYIDIDEEAMDVRLTNQENEDGTQGAPALYANIPIVNIKEKARNVKNETKKEEEETAKETETKTENNKTENKKSEDKNTKDKEEEDKQEDANENEKDSETKDVEEKAKKIVKEENSSHNNKEKKHKTEYKNSESEKIDKKESENE